MSRGQASRTGRLFHRRRSIPGSAPGTLAAAPNARAPTIRIIAYGPEGVIDRQNADPDEIAALRAQWPVVWVDVDGLGDVALLRRLGTEFGLHALALEDVLSTHQRPKVESYGDHLFIVTQMAEVVRPFVAEQLSLFLGTGYVLSFQERPGDCFDPIRHRIEASSGRFRANGADYLAYALLDAMIDGFFPVLETHGEVVEELEDRAIREPSGEIVGEVHAVKRDLLLVRRTLWPQREMIGALLRDEMPPVTAQTRVYLRDCYDHLVQLIDMTEVYREVSSSLFDLHMMAVSNRMNEVMKVLTIIATIFIPLGFIASVYGMNFETSVSPWNMPELQWYFGYPFALGLMAAVAFGFLLVFWRKGWLRRETRIKGRGRRRR